MEEAFWHSKWESNQIGFHLSEPNPALVSHFESLNLSKGDCVFIPLCGKTVDIKWLLQNGVKVVGAELSEKAIEELFKDLKLQPTISQQANTIKYAAEGVTIFVGNMFGLTKEDIGSVDAIYDRAALVALPKEMRVKYTRFLTEETNTAQQLLVSFQYDEILHQGPPFSVSEAEVNEHYSKQYSIQILQQEKVVNGLKGKLDILETIYLLN